MANSSTDQAKSAFGGDPAVEPSVIHMIAGSDDSAASSKGVFPFFKLPRELRDKIFSEVTKDVYVILKEFTVRGHMQHKECAALRSAPCPHVALVCRQFHCEYTEEMSRSSKDAQLTVYLGYVPLLLRRRTKSLERALSRIASCQVTHFCMQIVNIEVSSAAKKGLRGLGRLLDLMKSLKVLDFNYYEHAMRFRSRGHAQPYRPSDFTEANVRTLFSQHFSRSIRIGINIVCSLSLESLLFRTKESRQRRGAGVIEAIPHDELDIHAKNRIVFIAPPSTEPIDWPTVDLQVDESNTYSFEEVLEDVSRGVKGFEVWKAGSQVLHVG